MLLQVQTDSAVDVSRIVSQGRLSEKLGVSGILSCIDQHL